MKQSQGELYERWFAALEMRLTRVADSLFELVDVDVEGKQVTLASEAMNRTGESGWKEFDRLKGRYFQLLWASTRLAAFTMRTFPGRGIDPMESSQTAITHKSARRYFDILFETAPQAFAEFTAFISGHTGGYCGTQELFDDALIKKIVKGKTTIGDVRRLLGHALIHRHMGTETWTFRAARTQCGTAAGTGPFWKAPISMTSHRTLGLDIRGYEDEEVVRRISMKDSVGVQLPRL